MNNDIKKLKDKYKQNGYSSLTNAEKIEFLLSYSEKDTDSIKEIAEKILNTYNIINGEMKTNVFCAMNEFGISMESAILFNLIFKISKICYLNELKISSDNFSKIKLDSIDNSKKFFNAFFHNSYTEELLVVAVNENSEIINHKKFVSSESDMVEMPHKKIYHFAKATNSENIFFAHCHPHGSSEPSKMDIETTLKIKKMLDLLDINLIDHIIVGKDDATSMFEMLKNNTDYEKDITKV